MPKAKTEPVVRAITAHEAWELAIAGGTITVPAPCVLAPAEGVTLDGPASADKGELVVSASQVDYPVLTVTAS